MAARFLAACLSAVLLLGARPVLTWAEPIDGADKTPDANPRLMVRTYNVADLVVPISGLNTPAVLKPQQTLEGNLIKIISNTISPASWSDRGGPGTIEYSPLGMALVINQTPDVQEQIADLLATLRRAQDVEVALEVRVLTVPDPLLERIGVDFNVKLKDECKGEPALEQACVPVQRSAARDVSQLTSLAVLNDRQVAKLLEAVQSDPQTNVMQAPKLTLFNGQAASFEATEQQFFVTGLTITNKDGHLVATPQNEAVNLGFQMSVQPAVSADRKSVQVHLKANMTNLASATVPVVPVTASIPAGPADGKQDQAVPFVQFIQQPRLTKLVGEASVKIPDAGTVLLGGWKQEREGRTEFGPPVLSSIPYVNRLFKNVGYSHETEKVYLMVTPRIIIIEEEEALVTSTPCPAPERSVAKSASAIPDAGTEELAEPPCHDAKASASPGKERRLARILGQYQKACSEGHLDDARKLARKALAIDPACFSRKSEKTSKVEPATKFHQLQENDSRIWFTDEPSHLTPDRVDGGVQ